MYAACLSAIANSPSNQISTVAPQDNAGSAWSLAKRIAEAKPATNWPRSLGDAQWTSIAIMWKELQKESGSPHIVLN